MIKALFIIDAILYLILAIVGRNVYLKRKCQKVEIEKPSKPVPNYDKKIDYIDYQIDDLRYTMDEELSVLNDNLDVLNNIYEQWTSLEGQVRLIETLGEDGAKQKLAELCDEIKLVKYEIKRKVNTPRAKIEAQIEALENQKRKLKYANQMRHM